MNRLELFACRFILILGFPLFIVLSRIFDGDRFDDVLERYRFLWREGFGPW